VKCLVVSILLKERKDVPLLSTGDLCVGTESEREVKIDAALTHP